MANTLVVATADGNLWHTWRNASFLYAVFGPWQQFGDIKAQAGNIGYIFDVSCASGGVYKDGADQRLDVHVCALTNEGKLWHTIRSARIVQDVQTGYIEELAADWQPFGDVSTEAKQPEPLVAISCAYNRFGLLHLCGVGRNGGLWHTIRLLDGTWQPFRDVLAEAGNRGYVHDVTCSEADYCPDEALDVCMVTQKSGIWHTRRRHLDGLWDPFGDVLNEAGGVGYATRISASQQLRLPLQVLGGCELHVATAIADGNLWHTIRKHDGTWELFGDVRAQIAFTENVLDVSCCRGPAGGTGLVYSLLVSVATYPNGHLYTFAREPGGPGWTEAKDVVSEAGNIGPVTRVSMSSNF